MADWSVSFCSCNVSFFIDVLFLVTSHTGLSSAVKVKELQAWGRHHQPFRKSTISTLRSRGMAPPSWIASSSEVLPKHTDQLLREFNGIQLSILLSGDINPNPGPASPDSNKRSSCCRTVARNHRALVCSTCKLKYDIKCENVPPRKYKELLNATNIVRSCNRCHESLSKTQQTVVQATQPNRTESTQQDCHFSDLNMPISMWMV